MKTFGNIIWFLLTGLWAGIAYCFVGAIWCCTIIGIPFGLQCFKIAQLMFWPIGKEVNINFDSHPVANIIWLILNGWELCLGFCFVAILWCITIIGIPFGKQCFKLARLSLLPFGATIS